MIQQYAPRSIEAHRLAGHWFQVAVFDRGEFEVAVRDVQRQRGEFLAGRTGAGQYRLLATRLPAGHSSIVSSVSHFTARAVMVAMLQASRVEVSAGLARELGLESQEARQGERTHAGDSRAGFASSVARRGT